MSVTTEVSQTWVTRTTEQMDNEDNDVIGFTVDEDTYYHDCWLGLHDWKRHDETIVEIEHDDNGRLRSVELMSFGTAYDRSTEESYPVVWTRHIERTA